MAEKQNKIMILAGGTGGHIYPALAVAKYLEEYDWEIVWVGTERGLENKVVPANGYILKHINIKGFRGKNVIETLMFPLLLIHALYQAFKLIKQTKPDVVLGMGGFVSLPCGLASAAFNKPLVIHEQNAIAGSANKLLKHFADKVMYSFANTFSDKSNYVLSGNPVRKELLQLTPKQKTETINILIVGGSLGARKLNQIVPEVLAGIEKINILHQCGEQHLQATQTAYANKQLEADVRAFIDNMQSAYQWADLAICRAGAMTVAELAIVGVPAIFIPYPYAIDDHQRANAESIESVGGGKIILEKDLSVAKLKKAVLNLVEDEDALATMQKNIQAAARPKATQIVAEHCMAMVA